MKKLLCLLLYFLCCSVPLFSQIDPSSYEWAMISRGDNRPDFDTNDSRTKTLLISLHLHISPDEFQKTYSWSPEKYLEKVGFLISKNYAYEKEGQFYSSCMVVSDREGRDLFRYAEPLSQEIAQAIIANLDAIKNQYLKTDLSKTTAFHNVAFLILSDVLLDNWQISTVEREFLAKERPLRHGKNYYFALLQNLNSSRESFGIYGNAGLPNKMGVYGNNRRALSPSQIQKQSEGALVISPDDDAIFKKMASFFQPVLIKFLKENRGYIDEVYQKTGYSKEVSFEEFFIWWYHFIYTRATDILAEKGYLTIPEEGNFFYRFGSASEQSAGPARGVSPEADQILTRYVEGVGGKAALLRLSNEVRKGELKGERGTFAIESYAVPAQWTFTFSNDQERMRMQCRNGNCWMNGNPSNRITGTSLIDIASTFDMLFPLHVKEYLPNFQVVGKETVAGNPVIVLEGSSPTLEPTRLIFDSQTGLLVQLGATEFRDYRDCGGIKRPFTIISPSSGRATFSEIRHNQPLPAGIFEPGDLDIVGLL